MPSTSTRTPAAEIRTLQKDAAKYHRLRDELQRKVTSLRSLAERWRKEAGEEPKRTPGGSDDFGWALAYATHRYWIGSAEDCESAVRDLEEILEEVDAT